MSNTVRSVDVVIVGGGHNGLAMSKQLRDRSIDHVVLERHEVAHSWHTQRWDSFTLLTPNWQSHLPGHGYRGDDPDGFMTKDEISTFVGQYAAHVEAPVVEGVAATSLQRHDGGYRIATDAGMWSCRAVVVAGGWAALPNPPACAEAVPGDVVQVNPLDYRSPDDLPDGGILVVGAAATGIQLSEEIQASGRPVTLSLGEHVRMPRVYRGRDIQYWMDRIGRLGERYDQVEDLTKARAVASPQLTGSPERYSLDLNRLQDAGVQLRGRLGVVRDGVAMFSGGLKNHCALADQKLGRLLTDIDDWIVADGMEAAEADPIEPTRVQPGLPLQLDLNGGEISTVVWATGFRPDHSWIDLDVFDERGRIRHDGGVVSGAPGVYLLGAPFLRRRSSSFIHGSAVDTHDLAEHLAAHLSGD